MRICVVKRDSSRNLTVIYVSVQLFSVVIFGIGKRVRLYRRET